MIGRNELSSWHRNTWMNLKCLFGSERSHSRKATYIHMILCIWHSGKAKTIEILNISVVAQGLEWIGWIDEAQGNVRVVKLFCTILWWWIHDAGFVTTLRTLQHKEWTKIYAKFKKAHLGSQDGVQSSNTWNSFTKGDGGKDFDPSNFGNEWSL